MAFEAVKKEIKESKMLNPGQIYIPSEIRRKLDFNIGDNFEVLANAEDQELLIRKKVE